MLHAHGYIIDNCCAPASSSQTLNYNVKFGIINNWQWIKILKLGLLNMDYINRYNKKNY